MGCPARPNSISRPEPCFWATVFDPTRRRQYGDLGGLTMSRVRCFYCVVALLTMTCVFACSVGKTPPPPTEKVFFNGASLFLMGSSDYAPCGRFKFQGETLSLPADDEIASERIQYKSEVKPFCLDRHEVTVQQYEHCVLRDSV